MMPKTALHSFIVVVHVLSQGFSIAPGSLGCPRAALWPLVYLDTRRYGSAQFNVITKEAKQAILSKAMLFGKLYTLEMEQAIGPQ